MVIDYASLKQYIDSDPQYATLLEEGNHAALAKLLNTKGAAEIDRQQITANDLLAAIDTTEFSKLTTDGLLKLQFALNVTRGGAVNSKVLDLMIPAFPAGLVSAAALEILRTQPASVVEVLFGASVEVTSTDLGEIYKKPDQVQDEKMIVENGMIFVESADGKTRYALDEKGNVLRDQPIAVTAEVKP